MMKVAIIDYGAGNTQSVKYALNRIGYEGFLTSDEEEIKTSDKVIFPGVGEASSAMGKLKSFGLDTIIPRLTQEIIDFDKKETTFNSNSIKKRI